MRAATAMLTIAGLLLPAVAAAQVFEVGNDGAVHEAPGLATGDAQAPPRRGGPAAASDWFVQLGSYDSVALRDAAWRAMVRRHGELLKGRRIVLSEARIGGRRYYRLALAGFGTVRAAAALCRSFRAEGGACFVRRADAPRLAATG